MVSILSRSVASSGYRSRTSPGSSAASFTASASSTAPRPPSVKWLDTAHRAPAASARRRVASCSLAWAGGDGVTARPGAPGPRCLRETADGLVFARVVGRERVDGHDGRHPMQAYVLDLL